jgi:hypothetical protein
LHYFHRMGKRQTRIFKNDIAASRGLLQQRDVHVVDRTGRVFRGIVRAVSERDLTLQNQRLHSKAIPFEEIEEIVFDRESDR